MPVRLTRAELPFNKALGVPLAVCVSLGLLMAALVGTRAVRADDVTHYKTDAPLPPVYPPTPLVAWFNDDREELVPPAARSAAAVGSQMK